MAKAGWNLGIEGFTQWTPQGMTQAANALFASGKNVDAIAYEYTMEYFGTPFLNANRTPPIMVSDSVTVAFLRQISQAQEAGVDYRGLITNARSWYGRVGLEAGLMKRAGEDVDAEFVVPSPVANAADVLPSLDPGLPANTPVPTFFRGDLESRILAAAS